VGDFAILRLFGGEAVEVFGRSYQAKEQFSAGPVVGFLVDDVARVREEMEDRGVEFIGPVHAGEAGAAWSHFWGTERSTRSPRSRKANSLGENGGALGRTPWSTRISSGVSHRRRQERSAE